jgi:hypothetical protein
VTPVTIKIYPGISKTPTGSPIATATAPPPIEGKWISSLSSPELPKVKQSYTALATEESSIGNPIGVSGVVHFTVDPAAPTVVLKQPPPWTSITSPSFSGSASDDTPVTIKTYSGTQPEGTVVSEATATGTYGSWASGPTSPALPDGQYTAAASQYNKVNPGEVGTSASVTFIVDTVPPHVTLSAPASGSSSGNTTETASGTAGTEAADLPHVTAQLFSGSSTAGAPVQSITVNTVGKTWAATFGGLSPGTYTVRAVQADAAGNTGTSSASTFVVTGSSASAPSTPPAASFTWFPSAPRVGEDISLVSSATDAASPITAFAWDLAGSGAFTSGGTGMSVTFSTAGGHLVQLRATDASGLSSVASETILVSPAALPLMQPFPIVRITSTATPSGVRLRQLGVLAAPGAKITVLCRGRACPLKSQSHIATARKRRVAFVEFRRFERSLKAGVILEIRVSKSGQIGKYTRFAVRRRKVPVRFDACLDGVLVKPMICPSS